MIILGLTGSIGMGKSTTAAFFKEAGVPVWDADASVHQLYQKGGAAVEPVGELCPEAITQGAVDRKHLKEWLKHHPEALLTLEAIIHPLLREGRQQFIDHHRRRKAALVVLDIPLLFETGGEELCDATLVVSVDPEEQRRRVLMRPGITEADFLQLLSRQMPDAEKRARADYIIETYDKSQTRQEVLALIDHLTTGKPGDAAHCS